MDSEGKQKKKQRGFSKTCFRKKVVGRYCTLYPSRADHYLHCIYMMHFSFQTWKTEMGSKRYVTSKFNRYVHTLHTCNDACTFSGAILGRRVD